jgi:hypothetical protein
MLLVVVMSVMAIAPAAAQASSISGTVTDENTHAGIPGIEVCPNTYGVETECVETGSSGAYSLTGLPAGEYKVYFSAYRDNLKYVSEFYDNEQYAWEADALALASGEDLAGIDAELAEGGSITGSVSDETTDEPIAEIEVCAIDSQGLSQRCVLSGDDGTYALHGLRSGNYNVEYEGWNRVNYLTEFYEDTDVWAQAVDLTVSAPETVSGIDAKLAPGAQILGHVSEVGTGVPLEGLEVCAEDVAGGEGGACAWTDSAGDYAIRSIPAGTYVVGFAIEYLPFAGRTAAQWWKGASSPEEATVLTLTPPQTMTGIDAQLEGFTYPVPETGQPEETGSEPAQVLFLPVVGRQPLPKCRKGFHRKLVKGKKRCVRKHRRHHPRRHSHR